jgi:hypothetical protein
MGLQNIDIEACLRRMADRRIEEAMELGTNAIASPIVGVDLATERARLRNRRGGP